jgi:hypothetical protein
VLWSARAGEALLAPGPAGEPVVLERVDADTDVVLHLLGGAVSADDLRVAPR